MDEVDDSMPFFFFLLFFFVSRVPGPVRRSVDVFTSRWMTESFLISFFLSRYRALMVNNGRKGYKRGNVSLFRCMGRCHACPLHGRHDWIARAGF